MKFETHHEAPINPDTQPQTQKDKRDLIDPTPQGTRPRTDRGTQRIEKPVDERDDEDVAVGKMVLDEMGGDHLADAVGVDEADVEDEGHEVLVQDNRLQVEVGGDEEPGQEDGEEAFEGRVHRLMALLADFHHVEGAKVALVGWRGERGGGERGKRWWDSGLGLGVTSARCLGPGRPRRRTCTIG